jgi:hypothetical protein
MDLVLMLLTLWAVWLGLGLANEGLGWWRQQPSDDMPDTLPDLKLVRLLNAGRRSEHG